MDYRRSEFANVDNWWCRWGLSSESAFIWVYNQTLPTKPNLSEWLFLTSECPEVENKQLSLWDLGLLEMYGKNNSNRKSIFCHIAGLAFNPSPQHPTVAAENLRFNTPLATANARWHLPSHTIVDCISDSSSVSTVCWHKRLLIEVVTVDVY